MRRRSATRSLRWPTTRRDAGSWARPGVAARPRSTPGTAWPTATSVCSRGRRWHAVPARVVYLHHVGALSGAEGSLRLLLRHLARARVTPLSADAIRRRFAGSRGWDRSVTIVNAVDTHEFHPGAPRAPFRQELGVPDVSPLVGLVGRIGLGKGHEHFVDAAVRLLRGGTNAHFAIVGDPLFDEDAWRADALRRAVKDAGLEDRIRFVGYRRDVPEVMRGLDVLVLASDAEPCGRVLFEAMASGTAVVATSSGGTPEIVRDGLEGVLVPPRDPTALARAVGALVADAPRRARLGAAGVARVAAEFTIERYVARTLAVYDEALAPRRRR